MDPGRDEARTYRDHARTILLLMPLVVPILTTNLTGLGASLPLTVDSLRVVKLAALAVLSLVVTVVWGWGTLTKRAPIRWHSGWWLALGFLGIAALSSVLSMNPLTAVFGSYQYRLGLLTMLTLASVAFLTMQLTEHSRHMRALAVAAVAGGLPVAAYALVQVAGLDRADWGAPAWALARGFSTLGNPDHLGGYLIFPLALAVGLALSSERAASRAAWWSAAALSAAALLCAQSRGAWLGGLVAVAIIGAFVWRAHVRMRWPDYVALALIVVLLLGVGFSLGDSLQSRIEEAVSGTVGSGSGRLVLWEAGLRAVAEHPLLGAGPDSFRYAFYAVRPNEHEALGGFGTIADDAHSLPIMTAATVGLPALAVALVFGAVVLIRGTGLLLTPGAGESRVMLCAWLAALLGHTTYLLFGPVTLSSALLCAMAVGVVLAPLARPVPAAKPVAVRFAVAGMVLIGLVSTTAAMRTLAADYYYARSIDVGGASGLALAEDAVAYSPWTYEYRARRAELLAEAAFAAGTGADATAAANEALSAQEELVAFCPSEYLSYVNYANLALGLPSLGERGAALAASVSEEAIRVHPRGLIARTIAGAAYLRLQRFADARQVLQDDWASDPAFADAGLVYADSLLALAYYEEADSVIETLESRFPDNPQVAQLRAKLASSVQATP